MTIVDESPAMRAQIASSKAEMATLQANPTRENMAKIPLLRTRIAQLEAELEAYIARLIAKMREKPPEPPLPEDDRDKNKPVKDRQQEQGQQEQIRSAKKGPDFVDMLLLSVFLRLPSLQPRMGLGFLAFPLAGMMMASMGLISQPQLQLVEMPVRRQARAVVLNPLSSVLMLSMPNDFRADMTKPANKFQADLNLQPSKRRSSFVGMKNSDRSMSALIIGPKPSMAGMQQHTPMRAGRAVNAMGMVPALAMAPPMAAAGRR